MTKTISQRPQDGIWIEKPQRGLSIQPGVAQHAYVRSTPGIQSARVTTLKGLDPSSICDSTNTTPSGLMGIGQRLPRVDRYAVNRWAERWNAHVKRGELWRSQPACVFVSFCSKTPCLSGQFRPNPTYWDRSGPPSPHPVVPNVSLVTGQVRLSQVKK
jgi:hypothetical protein